MDRIIVLNSDAAEAVSILGAQDLIVASSVSVQEKAIGSITSIADKPLVGKWNDPDYEMIGEIARDGGEDDDSLLVISYSYPEKSYGVFAIEKGLSSFPNITVVALDFFRPENMTTEIDKLGYLLDREDKANDYIDWYQSRKQQVENAVKGKDQPSVYVEWSSTGGIGALSSMGTGSGFGTVLSTAGGYNVASDIEGSYPKVDWEWVVSQNPEYIIKRSSTTTDSTKLGWNLKSSEDMNTLKETLDEIESRPGASNISAVVNDNVEICFWDITTGLEDVVGMTYLAKMFYPESDLDPIGVENEYLQFIGVELPKDNIFIYPFEVEEQ